MTSHEGPSFGSGSISKARAVLVASLLWNSTKYRFPCLPHAKRETPSSDEKLKNTMVTAGKLQASRPHVWALSKTSRFFFQSLH